MSWTLIGSIIGINLVKFNLIEVSNSSIIGLCIFNCNNIQNVQDNKITEEQRQIEYNKHLRLVDSTIAELKNNRGIANQYFDDNKSYLVYHYLFSKRFKTTQLETLINSSDFRNNSIMGLLGIVETNTKSANKYLDNLEQMLKQIETEGQYDQYGKYEETFQNIFEKIIKPLNQAQETLIQLLTKYKVSVGINSFP
ncbi:MAG: hypothetical protein HY394_02470 [Candidatus Diapherotrites archaeon]|nr:hypothetical protein [Candidatus Diapherotrites archaeon]